MKQPDFYKLKPEYDGNEYPWPCRDMPKRTLTLFKDDVFTKQSNDKFVRQNGLVCINLEIPEDCLDAYEGWPSMTLNGRPYGKPKPVRKIDE